MPPNGRLHWDQDVLVRSVGAISILAALGTVLFTSKFIKSERSRARDGFSREYFCLIYILSTAIFDMSLSVLYEFSTWDWPDSFCTYLGILLQFCEMGSIIFNGVFMFSLYDLTVRSDDPGHEFGETWLDKTEKWIYDHIRFIKLGIFILALISVFLPFKFYGETENWCWIRGDTKEERIVQVLALYTWCLSILLSMAILVISSIHKIFWRNARYGDDDKKWYYFWQLFGYFIAFSITWIFPLIHRLYSVNHTPPPEWMPLMNAITASAKGGLNFIVLVIIFVFEKIDSRPGYQSL